MSKYRSLPLLAALLGAVPFAQAQQIAPTALVPSEAPTPGEEQRDQAAAKKAEFERTLRAQVLLERARVSPGQIDGLYGSNTRRALNTFQSLRNLPVTGKIDAATWRALNADSSPHLVSYTVVEADVEGPFRPVPSDMMEKARMPELGYASVLEGLGEKFRVSPETLERLNPGRDFERVGEQIIVPNVQGMPALPKASKVVVKESEKILQLYDAFGALISQYPVTTGSARDPLPIGTWKVNGVYPDPVYHYNPKLFWDSEPGDEKAKVPPGPNNPVGVVWIDLTKEHYGIHGTPVPRTIGKTDSHGCIRLTNWSASEVADAVEKGVEVVLEN